MPTHQIQRNNKLFILLCLSSVLCIVFFLIPVTLQNDTFYTIKLGELIAQEGLVPIDRFTFLEDLPYTYPHWLYDYGIYLLYQWGGFKAIYLSSLVLATILSLLLLYISYRISQNRFVTYFVVCATIMALALNFTARAQLITYILFIIEYGILYAYAQQRISRSLFFIVMMLISTLIVNLHCAIWILYFLIALPFVFEKMITNYLINKPYPLSSRVINISKHQYSALFILFVLLLSILTGFLTPLGDTPFTYLIKTYQGVSTKFISEHQPLVPMNSPIILIFILQMSYLLLFTRCKFYVRELLLLAGLCVLSILSERQLIILMLINGMIAPRLLTEAFAEQCPQRLEFYTKNIGRVVGVIISLVIILVISSGKFYTAKAAGIASVQGAAQYYKSTSYDDHDLYPVQAMDYFTENVDPVDAKVYADYEIGSYVLFRGFKPMWDSRADLYTIEFNHKKDYFLEIAQLLNYTTHYDDFFKKFKISHVLLRQTNPLNTYIKYDNKYPIIYEDTKFIIYRVE